MSVQQELRGTVSILYHSMISFPDLFISHAVPQTLFHKICHLLCQAEDKQRYGIPAVKYFPPLCSYRCTLQPGLGLMLQLFLYLPDTFPSVNTEISNSRG